MEDEVKKNWDSLCLDSIKKEKAEIGYCQCGCGMRTNLVAKSIPSRDLIKGQPNKFIYGHHRRGIPQNGAENNGMWKGNQVGCHALHDWVRRRKPKTELCQNCKEKEPCDLANISGEYKRDITDYEWLCRSCHMQNDGRIKALKRGKEPPKVVTPLSYPHSMELTASEAL